MEGVDPRDAAAVTARLVEWATGRFGAPVAPVAPPSSAGAGFDSYIHMVHLDGDALPAGWTGPLVVRILPTADRADGAHREAAVQGWCADRGFPAPRVLHVFDPGELLDLPVWPAIEAGAGVEAMGDHPARLIGAAAAAGATGQHERAMSLLAEAEAASEAAPTYYGDALVAIGHLLLTTDELGGCPPL